MRCVSFVSIVLGFYLSALGYAVAIPGESILSNDYPSTNQSLAYNLLQILDRYDSHQVFQNATFQTTQPWPPAPFNFRSTESPTWLLRVVSYEPPRLTFRQMHALVSLCHAAQQVIRTLDKDAPLEEKNYVFRATAQEPWDLTRIDVEVAIFNSPEEPGAAYKAIDMYTVLDIMLGRILPQNLPDMTRTVVHYAELQPRQGPLLRFRKVRIQRKTRNSLDNVIATA
ncbi:MAG: hypothetical protein HETSPECPRED_001881 [Heterodermia speciosa]|uniref:Uncharacterized protein n=1 Tax=Heterodermia speciosa TaxID=116794 RepID=A0A8H3PGC6_9LECA|nr:MAG: hypothetical protein HETSPECPRED_001881 [Heterodermia speciosa]